MNPTELCPFIEEWWGRPLDDRLTADIAGAAPGKFAAFQDALHSEGIDFGDSEVGPGRLRPIVTLENSSLALRMLLYSHEVLADVTSFDWPLLSNTPPSGYAQTLKTLRRIRDLRPLIEDGSLQFAVVNSRGRHPSRHVVWDIHDDEVVAQVRGEVRKLLGPDLPDEEIDARLLTQVFAGLSGAAALAEHGRGHMLATNPTDEIVRNAILRTVELPDKRQTHLRTLSSLQLPELNGNAEKLVRLRQDNELFAQWRSTLGEALHFVEGISETDETLQRKATQVVGEELKGALARLEKDAAKSPALSALKTGTKGFGLTAIGAVVGFAATGGNPLGALAGGASIRTVESVGRYVTARNERRHGKAIMDVAVMFEA